MYRIADLTLKIDAPQELLYKNLDDFYIADVDNPDMAISIQETDRQPEPATSSIYKNKYLTVYKQEKGYRYFYELSEALPGETTFSETGSCAMYADIDVETREAVISYSGTNLLFIRDSLFFAIRDVFFLLALYKGRIPIHSSSIIYREKAILFAAEAGVGKTTHTNMWRQMYRSEVLDGDVTMLYASSEGVLAYGLPWCGTSGLYQNSTLPLGTVVFLAKGPSNEIREYSYFESFVNLCARSFAPNFDKSLVSKSSELAKRICQHGNCLFYKCTPAKEAVEHIKNYLDEKIF